MPAKCKHCFGTGEKPNHKAIGKRLRALRLRSRHGLRQMALEIGVCPAFLSRLERGMARWNPSLIFRFERACSLAQFKNFDNHSL